VSNYLYFVNKYFLEKQSLTCSSNPKKFMRLLKFTLIWGITNCLLAFAQAQDSAQLKSTLITKMSTLIAGRFDLANAPVNVVKSPERAGPLLTGTCNILSMTQVGYVAEFSEKYDLRKLTIKADPGYDNSASGLDMLTNAFGSNSWQNLFIPADLRSKLGVGMLEFVIDNNNVLFQISAGAGLRPGINMNMLGLDFIEIDSLGILFTVTNPKSAKPGLGATLSGTIKWDKTASFRLEGTLATDPRDWMIKAVIDNLTLNAFITRFGVPEITLPGFDKMARLNQGVLEIKPFDYSFKISGNTPFGIAYVQVVRTTSEGVVIMPSVAKPKETDKKQSLPSITGGYKFTETPPTSGDTTSALPSLTAGYKPDTSKNNPKPPTVVPHPQQMVQVHKSNWGIIAGYQLPPGQSSNIPGFKQLQKARLNNIGVIISTVKSFVSPELPLFTTLNYRGMLIPSGITFIAMLPVDTIIEPLIKLAPKDVQPYLDKVNPIKYVAFRANVPTNITDFSLEGEVQFTDNVNLVKVLYFRKIKVLMTPFSGNPEFTFNGVVEAQMEPKKPRLIFEGGMGFQPTALTLSVNGALVNNWEKPYGIPNLSVNSLKGMIGLNFSGVASGVIYPDNFLLTGQLKMGNIIGDATIGIDANEFNKNLFVGRVCNLSMTNIFEIFCQPEIYTRFKSLSKFMQDAAGVELQDAYLKFVPPTAPTNLLTGLRLYADYTKDCKTPLSISSNFDPGIRIAGAGKILDWDGRFDLGLEGNLNTLSAGLKAEVAMKPLDLSINGFTVFRIRGMEVINGKRTDPQLQINLNTQLLTNFQSGNQKIIFGTADITILEANQAKGTIELTTDHFLLKARGKVYKLVEADVEARVKSFSNLGLLKDTYVYANIEPGNIIDEMKKYVPKEILDNGFELKKISFEGQLDGLQSGADASIEAKIAGITVKGKVRIKVETMAEFAKDLADAIKDEGLQVINKLGDIAVKITDDALDFAGKSAEEVGSIFQGGWKQVNAVVNDFTAFLGIGDDAERKRIRVSGMSYRIYTKYPGYKLHSGFSTETTAAPVYAENRNYSFYDIWQFVPAENTGKYYIVNGLSGLNLQVVSSSTASGASIKLDKHKRDDRANERYELLPVTGDPGWYYLRNEKSNLYATLNAPPNDAGYTLNANTPYFLVAKNSNLVLRMDEGKISQVNENDESDEDRTWQLVPNSNGTYYIKKVNNSNNFVMEIKDGKPITGQRIVREKMDNSPKQQFVLERQSDGSYKIASFLDRSKVMEVEKASTASPTPVVVGDWKGGAHQQFWLVPANRARILQTNNTDNRAKFRIERAGNINWANGVSQFVPTAGN
jgi:hypothetical protein